MKKKILLIIGLLFFIIPFVVKAEDESKIEINSLEYIDKYGKTEILEEASIEGINIKFNIKFYDEGDYARYKIVLKNNSDLELTIDEDSLVSSNEYIDYEFKYLDNSKIIGVGKEKEIELKILYKKDAPSILFRSSLYDASNTLEMSLGDYFISIPNTLRNIGILGMFFIFIINILIVIGIVLIYKNNKTSINTLIILFVLALILLPKCTKASEKYIIPINSKIIIQSVTPTRCTTSDELVQGLEYRISTNSQYVYRYKQEWNGTSWSNITTDGWGVKLDDPDSTDDVTEKLCSTINDVPITSMQRMFSNSKAKHIDLSSFVTDNVENMNYMFSNVSDVEELDFRTFNTEKLVKMNLMFENDSSLKQLTLRQFVTSNVTGYSGMFSGCSSLEKLNLDGWDVTKAGVSGGHLSGTTSLKEISARDWILPTTFDNWVSRAWGGQNSPIEKIDVTGWDVTNTQSMYGLFGDSQELKTIVGMDTWDTPNVRDISQLVLRCSKLTKLDLSGFDLTNLTTANVVFYETNSLVEMITPKKYQTSTLKIQMNIALFDKDDNIYYELKNGDREKEKIVFKNVALLDYGTTFNNKIKNLLSSSNSATGLSEQIERIVYSEQPPSNEIIDTNGIVSLSYSPRKVYVWFDSGTIYYYSEADTIYMHEYSGSMFSYLSYLSEVDLQHLNSSKVKEISYLFQQTAKEVENVDYDLSSMDISNVTNIMGAFNYFGYNSKSIKLNLTGLDTSNVEQLNGLFYYAGTAATNVELIGLSSWDVSKVKNASNAFYAAFKKASNSKIEIKNWKLKSATNVDDMFAYFGSYSENETFDFSNMELPSNCSTTDMFYNFSGSSKNIKFVMKNVDASKTKSLNRMFYYAFRDYSTNIDMDLSNWNVKGVEDTSLMFLYVGGYTNESLKLNLSGWNFENLKNTNNMFYAFGEYMGEYVNGDVTIEIVGLDDWNMSTVENVYNMFAYLGSYSNNTSIGDLSNWNVSNVQDFSGMFMGGLRSAKTLSIGDLSGWDFSSATNVRDMFDTFGAYATSETNIGTINIPSAITNISKMFNYCRSLRAVVNIYGNPTSYNNTFYDTSSNHGGIVVNYSSNTTNIDSIIGSNTHVVKGELLD
jgi:surface protein